MDSVKTNISPNDGRVYVYLSDIYTYTHMPVYICMCIVVILMS